MADPKQPKKLHGNNAKVEPGSKVVPSFLTNTVTMSQKKQHETPIVEDSNVAYARKFSQENQK